MSEWREIKLGDYVLTNAKSIDKNYPHQSISYLDTGSITCNKITEFQNFKLREAPSRARRLVKERDIIYSSVRPDQLHYGFIKNPVENLVVSTGFVTITCDENEVVPEYLYYYLAQSQTTEYLHSIAEASTSTYPSLKPSDIESIELLIPSPIEQTAIASILSSLDDKIDLLHRQNATLEKMAEALFRKWFVTEAKEEWESTTLFDAIELMGGGTPKTSIAEYWDGTINWLSGGDIAASHKSFIVKAEKTITELGLKNSSTKLLPKYATVISARGTVGKYCLLSEPMTYSQSNYGILPKVRECFFFTYLLIAHSVDELQAAAYGSVFDTITTNTFKALSVSLPSPTEIKEFEKGIAPYFEKMLVNQTQIRILTALRDTLLPKLMSGEVRVKI